QFLKTKEGQLVCAAHGAAFELSGGECVSGPCRGQSLFAVPVRVEDEQVLLG
ncbi:Rieske 2Fe-2S domain-containing protein, partial [Xanthomonas perforans]|nr:Rieske 2Fe-2S domain-containing protein [Xanthomonas perforans]